MQTAEQQTTETVKGKRKMLSRSLIGKWENNTVIGAHVFNVILETTMHEKDIRAAITALTEAGTNADGLTILSVTRERPVGVREVKRIAVKF